jgi:serine/threonine protein kinase
MAPEQCRNMTAIDARADLYALGCILFELLTGRPPFLAETGVAIVRMHLDEPPPRVVNYAPHVAGELDGLIAKLLVKSPEDRMPSAAYALAALERISLPPVGDVHVLAAPRIAAGARDQRTEFLEHPLGAPPSKQFPIVVIVIAVLIAAAAVVGIGLYA